MVHLPRTRRVEVAAFVLARCCAAVEMTAATCVTRVAPGGTRPRVVQTRRSHVVRPARAGTLVLAAAVATGVTLTDVLVGPAPRELSARRRTPYVVPLVRPLMTTGLVVVAGEAAVHAPSLSEYS